MRLEFCGKTKSTIVDITVLSLKMGQTDTVPAMCVSFKTPMPNTVLNALDKSLRTIFYEKAGSAAKTQQQLEGIDQVTDLPQLTELGQKLAPIYWPDEQSGSKLAIYHGIGATPAWSLKDGTVRKVKCEPKEGGTVDVHWQFYTADVDAETIGELAVLKSHEVDLELTAAEVIQPQASIDEDEDDDRPVGPANPLDAMLGGEPANGAAPPDAPADGEPAPGAAWPFPTSAHEQAKDVKVTKKRSRKTAEQPA